MKCKHCKTDIDNRGECPWGCNQDESAMPEKCRHDSIADLGFLYPNYTCQKCGQQFGENHPQNTKKP
jgi:hypothetical protein